MWKFLYAYFIVCLGVYAPMVWCGIFGGVCWDSRFIRKSTVLTSNPEAQFGHTELGPHTGRFFLFVGAQHSISGWKYYIINLYRVLFSNLDKECNWKLILALRPGGSDLGIIRERFSDLSEFWILRKSLYVNGKSVIMEFFKWKMKYLTP